jgi:hypothetical protein
MFLMNVSSKLTICSAALIFFLAPQRTIAVTQDPPSKVEFAFKQQFPSINEVKWAKSDNTFVAEFKDKHTQVKASFDSSGNFVESEQEIDIAELPQKVVLYILTQDETAKIFKAYKIERAGGTQKVLYDVVARIHYKKSKITISKDGYLTSH